MRFTARIDAKTFDELVRPKLRLFLSVDIVGSSDFKYQQTTGPGPGWVFPFLNFYLNFPQFLDAAVLAEAARGTKKKSSALEKPPLWKALGDELIFVVELKERHEAALYLRAFRQALQEAAANWPESQGRIQFKGTAWLAGFPLGNAEVPVAESPERMAPLPDFVGPQIDAGFRLKEHATPRKFVLSADLAYLLVVVGGHDLELFFDGDQPLKGIMRGKPYPLIWLDADVCGGSSKLSLNQKKDKLLGRKPASKNKLQSYLDAWLVESGGQVSKPFIAADPFADLRQPKNYPERLRGWKATISASFLVVPDSPENAGETQGHELPAALSKLLKH